MENDPGLYLEEELADTRFIADVAAEVRCPFVPIVLGRARHDRDRTAFWVSEEGVYEI